MTMGMAASLQNKCLLCRVLELDSRYRQIKYKKLTKKQFQVKYTKLNEKFKNVEDEDHESTSSYSEDHDKDDPEFIPQIPQVTHAKRKLHRQNDKNKRTKIHTTSSENEVVERSEPEETAYQQKKKKKMMVPQIIPKANVLFKNI